MGSAEAGWPAFPAGAGCKAPGVARWSWAKPPTALAAGYFAVFEYTVSGGNVSTRPGGRAAGGGESSLVTAAVQSAERIARRRFREAGPGFLDALTRPWLRAPRGTAYNRAGTWRWTCATSCSSPSAWRWRRWSARNHAAGTPAMAPAMSPEWRKVNLICSLDGHGRVVQSRQPIPPIRPNLLALFDVAELTKYMTGNELAGSPAALGSQRRGRADRLPGCATSLHRPRAEAGRASIGGRVSGSRAPGELRPLPVRPGIACGPGRPSYCEIC